MTWARRIWSCCARQRHIVMNTSANTRFGHRMDIGSTLVIVLVFAGLGFVITTCIVFMRQVSRR